MFVVFILSLTACSLDPEITEEQTIKEFSSKELLKEMPKDDLPGKVVETRKSPVYLADFNSNYAGFSLEDNTLEKGLTKLVKVDERDVVLLENSGKIDESWKLQLKKVGIPFVADKYKGKIWIKGENLGVIFVSVERAIDPWDNLGLWKELDVTMDWKEYDLSFTISEAVDPENIKFSIQFGTYPGKLWIDGVVFE